MKSPDVKVPNAPVDKSSWGASACYPRRTFDPLSESPSTRNSRITMTDFRLCLTCPSHSQAGLCHYALQLISDQLEPTFAHLRYSLGGDRPSQTTDHAMSEKISWGNNDSQGGISRTLKEDLGKAFILLKLPPILHKDIVFPLQSYSKGARGLTV